MQFEFLLQNDFWPYEVIKISNSLHFSSDTLDSSSIIPNCSIVPVQFHVLVSFIAVLAKFPLVGHFPFSKLQTV